MRSIFAVAVWTLLLSACEPGDAGYIPYVPGPGFQEKLQIWIEMPDSAPAATGQWLTLHAARQSGPWVLEDTLATEEPRCKKISPIEREFEVASKVRWEVKPTDESVGFNIPGPPDFQRQIRFNRPGRYQVRAVSEGCGAAFASNPVEVVVQ